MQRSTDDEEEEAGCMEDIDDCQVENGLPAFNEKIFDIESKVGAHDNEIILLKAALSDALSRLNFVEAELKKTNVKTKKDITTPKIAPGRKQRPKPLLSSSQAEAENGKNSPKNSVNGRAGKKSLSLSSVSSTTTLIGDSETAKAKPKTKPKPKKLSLTENLTEKIDDGKPKIILARKAPTASPKKPKLKSLSQEESPKSPKDDVMKFFIRGRGLNLYPPTGYHEEQHDDKVPDKKLKLNWVYGYRGKDCRENLVYLPSGDVVYNIAGVIVLYDTKTKTQRHYTEHTDDVKSIAVHPNNVTIASGQVAGHGDDDKKPHVNVWDSVSLERLSTFGHGVFERGLCVMKFSNYENGKYLACMDDSNDHTIYVYEWEKGLLTVDVKASKDPVLGAKWNPITLSQFVTYGKSHLVFWTLSLGDTQSLTKKAAIYEKIPKPKFVQSVVYTNEGDLVTGDSNGNILLFKNDRNRVSSEVLGAHTGGVFCVLYLEEKEAILSSGRDGLFSLWNKSLEKLTDFTKITEQYGPARCIAFNNIDKTYYVSTAKNCILQYDEELSNEDVVTLGHHDEMWGLATHPTMPLVATCAQDQLVCVWDSEKKTNIWIYYIEEKGECAEFHPTLDYVLVGTKCGTVHFLNYSTFEEEIIVPVARDCISDIKVAPDGKAFAAACRDTKIYLYTWPDDGITAIGKATVMQGHSSRVLHLDWSSDSEYLQSNSADYELLFWSREAGLQILSPAALRDVSWSTWTCPFGFPVQGIWPEGADGTDINACGRSCDNKLIATGDDFGEVKVYRYPSVKLRADGNPGIGHSSHVTCVRFTAQDSSLISVGGQDCSIMQWSLV